MRNFGVFARRFVFIALLRNWARDWRLLVHTTKKPCILKKTLFLRWDYPLPICYYILLCRDSLLWRNGGAPSRSLAGVFRTSGPNNCPRLFRRCEKKWIFLIATPPLYPHIRISCFKRAFLNWFALSLETIYTTSKKRPKRPSIVSQCCGELLI